MPSTPAASPVPAPGKYRFRLVKPAYRDGIYFEAGEVMDFDNPDHAPEGSVPLKDTEAAPVVEVVAPKGKRASDGSPV